MARRDLDLVALMSERVEEMRAALTLAIIKARQSGETYRDIAEAAGMSHPTVMKLVREQTSYVEPEERLSREARRVASALDETTKPVVAETAIKGVPASEPSKPRRKSAPS
jgi:hypothetical protein